MSLYSFYKVTIPQLRIEEELEREKLKERITDCEEHAHKRMDDILSQMDSRFDKSNNSHTQSQHNLERYVESLIKNLETKINNNNNSIP